MSTSDCPAQTAARRHRADEHARIACQVTHADAVAQDGAACERAGGINGDDADRPPGVAIRFGQLGDER
jgi:hypothetical protein